MNVKVISNVINRKVIPNVINVNVIPNVINRKVIPNVINMNVISNVKRRDMHPLKTASASCLTFLLTGRLAEGGSQRFLIHGR